MILTIQFYTSGNTLLRTTYFGQKKTPWQRLLMCSSKYWYFFCYHLWCWRQRCFQLLLNLVHLAGGLFDNPRLVGNNDTNIFSSTFSSAVWSLIIQVFFIDYRSRLIVSYIGKCRNWSFMESFFARWWTKMMLHGEYRYWFNL